MFSSTFQNYLKPFIDEGLLQDTDQSKSSNIYEQVRIAYNQGAIGLMNTTKFFIHSYEGQDPDEYDYDLLYEIWRNKKLQEEIAWFNSKIIPDFAELSYMTIGVRVRIMTSKLNKLVDNGDLDVKTAIKLHLNMTEIVENEKMLLVNENLPF